MNMTPTNHPPDHPRATGHHDGSSHGHDHAHDQDHAQDLGHADFTAHWRFHCENPQRLDHIDIRLFQAFPATQRIRVQAITPKGQIGVELSPASARLHL